MDRRRFLRLTAMTGAGLAASGCLRRVRPLRDCVEPVPELLVPEATRAATRGSPLAVDVHTHIFNGHDVPMEEYFTRPVLHAPPPLDALIREIIRPAAGFIRWLAPDAATEQEKLCELVADHAREVPPSLIKTEQRIQQEIEREDERFAETMEKIANREPFRSRYRAAEARELEALGQPRLRRPEARITAAEILDAIRPDGAEPDLETRASRRLHVAKIWSFLRRLAAWRYHNAYQMLKLYGTQGSIDIFVASSVDFDASLRHGKPWCSTPIADQVRLMDAISMLTNRRILPMVGYDPRRDVATEGAALQEVRDAMSRYGHVGVKLYPPMGFAAHGNATLSHDCDWPDEENYGAQIQQQLDALYAFCDKEEIPLIAHSSESMGITRECQHNGDARDWQVPLAKWDGLRVCAGHFGGVPRKGSALSERMTDFMKLMSEPAGRNLYADLAYLPEVFDAELPFGNALAKWLVQQDGEPTIVAKHVLYGSDWYMIAQHPIETQYAKRARCYLHRIGGERLVQRVFAKNAVDYLNLANLYKSQTDAAPRDGAAPHWLNKVSALQ